MGRLIGTRHVACGMAASRPSPAPSTAATNPNPPKSSCATGATCGQASSRWDRNDETGRPRGMAAKRAFSIKKRKAQHYGTDGGPVSELFLAWPKHQVYQNPDSIDFGDGTYHRTYDPETDVTYYRWVAA